MDYKEELKRLQEVEANIGSEYWKPEAGQYKLKGLGELEDAPPYEEEGKEPQPRKMIDVHVISYKDKQGKEKIINKASNWSMPFGKTPASTYGQLVNLAVNKGQIKDTEFMVIVVGEGQNKRFTIVLN